MPASFKVANKSVPSGRKLKTSIRIAELSDNTPIFLPLIVVNGRKSGPTLILNSGIHGSEWTGMEVVRETALELSPDDLKGTVVAIPGSNPFAYLSRQYVNLLSMDTAIGGQVQYPGDSKGTYPQRLGHFLLNEIFLKGDVLIDTHDGAAHWICRYIALSDTDRRFPKIAKKKLDLARAFGAGLPIEDHPLHPAASSRAVGAPSLASTSLAGVLAQKGIPHITPELGGMMAIWPEDISGGVTGMNNIMKHMGMLEGEPEPSEQIVFTEYEWIRAERGGVVRTAFPATSIPRTVKKGERLCTVTTMLGDTIQTVDSPYDAVIFCARGDAACLTGDWLYGVGKIP